LNSSELRAQEIVEFYNTLPGPFPYDDCRFVLGQGAEHADALIPTLDLYFSTIAGYASSARRIAHWSADRVVTAKADLANSFFENHPEYELLLRYIDRGSIPDLVEDLESYEILRLKLVKLLHELYPST
jgi:hypothetical protein